MSDGSASDKSNAPLTIRAPIVSKRLILAVPSTGSVAEPEGKIKIPPC